LPVSFVNVLTPLAESVCVEVPGVFPEYSLPSISVGLLVPSSLAAKALTLQTNGVTNQHKHQTRSSGGIEPA
jgi:hypothetical protein